MKYSAIHKGAGFVLMGLAGAAVAAAHPGHLPGADAAFASGLVHPVLGLDHLLAAVASGAIAVRLGIRRALWLVPGGFAACMLIGAALAPAGAAPRAVEWGISASVILLGLVAALHRNIPSGAAAAVVAGSALLHGLAHGAEACAGGRLEFVGGVVVATLAIHAAVIGCGLIVRRGRCGRIVRTGGAAAALGLALAMLCGGPA